jgi:hypothetical protein
MAFASEWNLVRQTFVYVGPVDMRTFFNDNFRTFVRLAYSIFTSQGFSVETPTTRSTSLTELLEYVAGRLYRERLHLFRVVQNDTLECNVHWFNEAGQAQLHIKFADYGDVSLQTIVAIADTLSRAIHGTQTNYKTRQVFAGEPAIAETYKPSRHSYRLLLDAEAPFDEVTYLNFPSKGMNAGKRRRRRSKH